MKLSPGSKAWIGLATYVAAYDAWAVTKKRETLSEAFYAALKNPRKRWRAALAWAYVTTHLFHVLPENFDPLRHPLIERVFTRRDDKNEEIWYN